MAADLMTTDDVLRVAAQLVGIDATDAVVIRDGSNVMYRLRGGIAARVGKPGTLSTAAREVAVSRWLLRSGVPATEALDSVVQPVEINNRPVTWWALLPDHRPATPAELGMVLRSVHALPIPAELGLPVFDPFADLGPRIALASGVPGGDRVWLLARLAELRDEYGQLDLGERECVVHGDAWQGNVAVLESGAAVLLDLERVSTGHPQWDQIQIAVDRVDFARLTAQDYRSFVDAYGAADLTTTREFRTLASIQELRWTSFVLGKSAASAEAADEARHRIACLRGRVSRPWSWTAF